MTHTFVNLQGELDKKYQVGFYLSDKPKREIQKAGWPKDAEDNLERLKDAGMPMERGIPKCPRCNGEIREFMFVLPGIDSCRTRSYCSGVSGGGH